MPQTLHLSAFYWACFQSRQLTKIWHHGTVKENRLHFTGLLQSMEGDYRNSESRENPETVMGQRKMWHTWLVMADAGPDVGEDDIHTLCTGTNLTQRICFTEEERILQNGKLYAQNHQAGEWQKHRLSIRFLTPCLPLGDNDCPQTQEPKPAGNCFMLSTVFVSTIFHSNSLKTADLCNVTLLIRISDASEHRFPAWAG